MPISMNQVRFGEPSKIQPIWFGDTSAPQLLTAGTWKLTETPFRHDGWPKENHEEVVHLSLDKQGVESPAPGPGIEMLLVSFHHGLSRLNKACFAANAVQKRCTPW